MDIMWYKMIKQKCLKIEVQLIYNVALISAIQQSDPYIYIHTHTHTHILLCVLFCYGLISGY